jgi:hypothetical protein
MADEESEKRGFTVRDRRRFSDSGEPREESESGAETPETPPPGAAAETAAAQSAAAESTAGAGHGGAGPSEQLPPEINFPTFVISLCTQALAHLGEIPDPSAGETRVDLGAARQLIDILAMLQEKTTGNLERDEATLLEHALYDLRMKYVERAHKG